MTVLLTAVLIIFFVVYRCDRAQAALIHDGGRLGIQAHRGYSGRYPENTLLAFEKAVEVGADLIELDIRAAKDGTVFVLHDATVDRTTNGKGALRDLTAADVKALDAGAWFASEYAGQCVPTLAETLDLLRGRIRINIEIKVNGAPMDFARTAVEGALQLVEERDMYDQVFFSSFSLDALYWAKRLQPKAWIALLDWDRETWQDRQETVLGLDGQGWLPHPAMATQQRVSQAQQRGLFVTSGAGNHPDTRKESVFALLKAGVNFISTNYPAEVIEVLTEGPDAPCQREV